MNETPSTAAVPFRLISAATTNATTVKATPGRIFKIAVSNINAAIRYLKIYNLATTPNVGVSPITFTFAIQSQVGLGTPNITSICFGDKGVYLSAGIGLSLTAGAGDADATAIGAGDVIVNMTYL